VIGTLRDCNILIIVYYFTLHITNNSLLLWGKLHFVPPKFHPNCNFASKVKKAAMNSNKVSKICNVVIPLLKFILLDRNELMCDTRGFLRLILPKISLNFFSFYIKKKVWGVVVATPWTIWGWVGHPHSAGLGQPKSNDC
jgi:hypothetical protein